MISLPRLIALVALTLLAVFLSANPCEAKPLRVLCVVASIQHDTTQPLSVLQWTLKRDEEVILTVSRDTNAIAPQQLQNTDVLVLFAPDVPLSAVQVETLREYVQRGGGLVCIHTALPFASPSGGAATATEPPPSNLTVFVNDTRHPIMQGVVPFQTVDIPAQIDIDNVQTSHVLAQKHVDGKPIAWAQNIDRGRVFLTVLGHSWQVWEHPSFQTMIRNGVYWCAKRSSQRCVPRPPKGYVSLFNGVNLEGWGEVGPLCWRVQDGVIVCTAGSVFTGWLRTNRMYRNFFLRLEYRISPGGNSGIFLRAPHFGRSSRLGMELQIQDDGTSPPSNTCTSAVYSVVTPRLNPAKPAGEWNQVEITLRDRHLKVVWNGQLVHDINLDDPALNENLPRTHKLYRRPSSGYIGLQNHRSLVEFRNIFIKELQ